MTIHIEHRIGAETHGLSVMRYQSADRKRPEHKEILHQTSAKVDELVTIEHKGRIWVANANRFSPIPIGVWELIPAT